MGKSYPLPRFEQVEIFKSEVAESSSRAKIPSAW